MIIDSHTHLFRSKIIANVANRKELVRILSLETQKAANRCRLDQLEQESRAAGVEACLLLPTATAKDVVSVNHRFLEYTKENRFFLTAGTLHPHHPGNAEVLDHLASRGVRAIKLCSFSQGFSLDDAETEALFDQIRQRPAMGKTPFCVILDTFYKADFFFGSPEKNTTTPDRLGRLVKRFPELRFVAAHMGGLTAPFSEILEHLPPRHNLYLDTSNAAHTLTEQEFIRMLRLHGPERILFGTDWPWFGYAEEIPCIDRLLKLAGFSKLDIKRVFAGNIMNLLALSE
ncbi:MAG: amidohydrolase family protein [Planctomycetota bacterium]